MTGRGHSAVNSGTELSFFLILKIKSQNKSQYKKKQKNHKRKNERLSCHLAPSVSADVVVKHEAGVIQEQRFHLLKATERQFLAFSDSSTLPH